MESKKQLSKELAKWMVKEHETYKRWCELLPDVSIASPTSEVPSWTLSLEKIDEIERVEKELDIARDKVRKLMHKLQELK